MMFPALPIPVPVDAKMPPVEMETVSALIVIVPAEMSESVILAINPEFVRIK
jgi:hypothetical protein